MLIEVINCDPSTFGSNDIDRISSLNNLIHSHGYKHNIVIGSKKTIKGIMISPCLQQPSLLFINDIYDSLSEYTQFKTKVDFFMIVDFVYDGCPRFEIDANNIKNMIVSYKYFSSHENLSPIKLLTENITDHDIYNKIALSKIKGSDLDLPFKVDFQNGGGSQIKTNYNYFKNRNTVCLCIVDTDKKHPCGNEGTTSASFSKTERKYHSSAYVKILDAHEIESYIPHNIIREVLMEKDDNAELISSFDMLMRLEKIDPRVRLYFDYKEGINLKKAIELDCKHGDFWLPILGTEAYFSAKPCLKTKKCDDCGTCPKIIGYGDRILSSSLKKIETMTPHKLAECVKDPLHELWIDIKKQIISWGCIPVGRLSRS
jgi:hypothetical protein